MEPEIVLKTWFRYGLADLAFAEKTWNSDDGDFRYAVFFYITAVEKHLKAILMYEHGSEYEGLDRETALEKIDHIARKFSHKFHKMIAELNEILERNDTRAISPEGFKYSLDQFIDVMNKGYMEVRYPTIAPVAQNFLLQEGVYHDLLGSSDFVGFLKYVCVICKNYIVSEYDLEDGFVEKYAN